MALREINVRTAAFETEPPASATGGWDRSPFAISAKELEMEETVRALERLLDRPDLADDTIAAIRRAIDALHCEG